MRRLFTVHVNRAELVENLVDSFRRSGYTAERTGPWTCAVEQADALDEQEARVEVTFFLRAWGARHHRAHASLAT
jgi:hypothetical protein